MKKIPSVLLIFIFAIKFSAVAQQGHLHIINTFHIGGFGKWDYIQVGPVDNLLYVSHGTQVNIINKNTGDSVGVIQNTIGVHGIAFDVENNKGFTSNGRSNSITVFNMNTNKIIKADISSPLKVPKCLVECTKDGSPVRKRKSGVKCRK